MVKMKPGNNFFLIHKMIIPRKILQKCNTKFYFDLFLLAQSLKRYEMKYEILFFWPGLIQYSTTRFL